MCYFSRWEKISSTFQNLSRINSFHLSTQLEIYTHTTSGDEREFNSCRVMYICIYRAGKRRLASFTIYNDNRRRDRGNTKDPGHLGDCRHFLYSLFIDFIFFWNNKIYPNIRRVIVVWKAKLCIYSDAVALSSRHTSPRPPLPPPPNRNDLKN